MNIRSSVPGCKTGIRAVRSRYRIAVVQCQPRILMLLLDLKINSD